MREFPIFSRTMKTPFPSPLTTIGAAGLAAWLLASPVHAEEAQIAGQATAPDLQTLFVQAMQKVENGDTESVMSALQQVLDQHPDGDRIRMELALLAAFLARPTLEDVEKAEAEKAKEPDVLFAKGMRELKSGDLELAKSAFKDILDQDPDADRVRMELAVANLKSYDYAQAESLAEEVLAKPSTPERVKVRVEQFMDVVEKNSEPHIWKPYVSVGFKYDDNVNVGPSNETISGMSTGDLNATLGEDSMPKEDTAWVGMAGVKHTLQTGETFDIGGRTAAFFWQSGASLYRNDYSTENEYDITVASINTGPTLIAARSWKFNLDGRFDNIYLDNDHLADYVTANPNVTFSHENGKVSVKLDAKWQKRDFTHDDYVGRDSDRISAGTTVRYRPTKGSKLEASGRLFNESADFAHHTKKGFRLGIGGETKAVDIDDNATVYGYYTYQGTEHKGTEPGFEVARDDDKQTTTLGVRYAIDSDYLHLDDWVINAAYTHMTNDSNIPLYEYDRNQIGVSVRKVFQNLS